MEQLGTIFNSLGILVAALAGGLSLVMFGFAGIQYMTAQGDPQAMGRAKMSVIGAVVGLAIAGLAFVVPGIVSRVLIEPAGGASIQVNTGDNCDQLLRDQLVFQRSSSTQARMQEIVRRIQVQRANCDPATWNPVVDDTDGGISSNACPTCPATIRCWPTSPLVSTPNAIGLQQVPSSLYIPHSTSKIVRDASGRDSDNNVIVYWSPDAGKKPSDGSACWLYVARLNVWTETVR